MLGSSVLCWLATVDQAGEPNVSPKEMFTVSGERHLAFANIASPTSARNVLAGSRACASFVGIFVQKGYKVNGSARYIRRDALDFASVARPLVEIAEPRFKIHGIILVEAERIEPILAPSYRLDASLDEASQSASALERYEVAARLAAARRRPA